MKHRIGHEQAWILYLSTIGVQLIPADVRSRRLHESLARLGLHEPGRVAKATELGRAFGAYLARAHGDKLTRTGGKLLASHRPELRERFDLPAAELAIERALKRQALRARIGT